MSAGCVARWGLWMALLARFWLLGRLCRWILDRAQTAALELQAAACALDHAVGKPHGAQARLAPMLPFARRQGGAVEARPGDGRNRADPKLELGGDCGRFARLILRFSRALDGLLWET